MQIRRHGATRLLISCVPAPVQTSAHFAFEGRMCLPDSLYLAVPDLPHRCAAYPLG